MDQRMLLKFSLASRKIKRIWKHKLESVSKEVYAVLSLMQSGV